MILNSFEPIYANKIHSMKEVMLALHQKPVAYYPVYKDVTGSTTAGILLSQLMYWWQKVGGREFYKTDSEIIEETHLSAQELKTAKKALKVCDFIKIKARGVPAKTFYDIDTELLIQTIQKGDFNHHRKVKSTKLKSVVKPYSDVEINNTITENTTENTTENISFSKEKEPFQNSTEKTAESPKNQPEQKEEPFAVDVITPKEEKPELPKKKKTLAKKEKIPALGTLAKNTFSEWYENEVKDAFDWTAKDVVNVYNLIKKIKLKVDTAIEKERTDIIYKTDAELIELAFVPFLQKYSKLKTWYSDSKTPSNMIARFNDIWKDIKTIDCNGQSTKLTGARAAIADLLQKRYAKTI